MYDQLDLDQRFVIIRSAGLDDAEILDENYTILIKNSSNFEEEQQLRQLRSTVKARIKELSEHA